MKPRGGEGGRRERRKLAAIPRCSRAVSHSRRERQVGRDDGEMPLVSNLRRIYSSKVTRRHLLPVPSASFRRRRVTGYDDSSCHGANVLPTPGKRNSVFSLGGYFFSSFKLTLDSRGIHALRNLGYEERRTGFLRDIY